MDKTVGFFIALCGVAALLLFVGIMYISANNSEVALRNQAVAVQRDLHNLLDATKKKISQSGQVTAMQMGSIEKIVIGNAQARGGSGGSLATSLHEAVPNLSTSTPVFTNLQNIITGARDQYAAAPTRLIDVKREHDNLLDKMPSSWFVGGRPRLDIVIVTSTATEKAFTTGVDDDDRVVK